MHLLQPQPHRLVHHFDRLCALGGRLSGTASEAAALDHVAQTLAALDNGRLQVTTLDYQGWTCREAWIEIDGVRHAVQALPGAAATGGARTLDVADAGRGTPEEIAALGETSAGKALVVTHEYMFADQHVHRSRKFAAALQARAGAFIIANPWPDSGVVSGGTSFGETHDLPAVGVSKQTGDAIRAAAREGRPIRLLIDAESARRATRTLDWRIAAPGGNSAEEVIVCAHVDGHAPAESAVDNASGCAVALALAEAVNETGLAEGRSLRLLFFSIEEWGLLASKAYVDALTAEERARIALVVNLDSVAGDDRLTAMTSGFAALPGMVARAAALCGIDVGIHAPLVRNSDHYNFAAAGIPALRMIAGFNDPRSNLRHVLTAKDTRGLVDGAQLERAAALTAALVALARAPQADCR